MIEHGYIRHYINIVTSLDSYMSVLVSVAVTGQGEMTQYTIIGQPLAEVRRALLSDISLGDSLRGLV